MEILKDTGAEVPFPSHLSVTYHLHHLFSGKLLFFPFHGPCQPILHTWVGKISFIFWREEYEEIWGQLLKLPQQLTLFWELVGGYADRRFLLSSLLPVAVISAVL